MAAVANPAGPTHQTSGMNQDSSLVDEKSHGWSGLPLFSYIPILREDFIPIFSKIPICFKIFKRFSLAITIITDITGP